MMRIAVLGLFNSGSTCLSGVLNRVGIDMGGPFWETYYEPYDLATILRVMWNEPTGDSSLSQEDRVVILGNWICGREAQSTVQMHGAKHPLLCLSANDLLTSWGADTKFVWSYRDLKQSLDGLHRRGWFHDHETRESLQNKLWDSVNAFASFQSEILRVDYKKLLVDKDIELDRLFDYLNISPSASQRQRASDWISQAE